MPPTPEFDRTQLMITDIPARLRSLIDVIELPTLGTADNIHEAVALGAPLPAAYGIIGRTPAKIVQNGSRLVAIGSRRQVVRVLVSIAVVTESYGPTADGRIGGWAVLERVADALAGWKSPAMLKRFQFVDAPLVMRTPDGTRVVHEVQLEGEAEVFKTPAPA